MDPLILRAMMKQKAKPKPTPVKPGKGPAVPLPGYPTRQGLDTPTQWGGKKGLAI